MKKTYYRGDVYMADLGQGIGSEQGGSRPVVIVQNDTGNHFSPTVIVAAMTSKGNSKAKLPTHFVLEKRKEKTHKSTLTMTLCPTCADAFCWDGEHTLKRVDAVSPVKDLCTFCGQRYGYEYRVFGRKEGV